VRRCLASRARVPKGACRLGESAPNLTESVDAGVPVGAERSPLGDIDDPHALWRFSGPPSPDRRASGLQYRSDIALAAHLDRLGFDEFWCGEHHSTGWETIASPEMFLAAAGENTRRIMLGTGVVSLPYHHPFNVAQRMVQLDHMTGGRAIFGSGPAPCPRTPTTWASTR
jgi:alkanesulfonate monooxygenase SsuD/methylene tetrahydromethanopterin reductase-like flavin-dependent oxidoreductase (luciferase family)